MDVRQLRYFIAIVEDGSVSAAAARIGIAQPSLSQHIRSLEDRLGVELLVRSSRGVTPTEAGRLLEVRAREILDAIARTKEEVGLAGTVPRGRVSLGLPSSVSMVLSVPLAEAVRRELPEVNLRVVEAMSGFIRDWLRDGSIDLGVLYDVEALRHMQTRLLMTERLHLFAGRAGWPLATPPGEPVRLADAAALELVLPSTNHGLRALIERHARDAGIGLRTVVEMDSLAQIKRLVARGTVHTILARASVEDAVGAGELAGAPIVEPEIRRPIHLVRNPERVGTRAAREVEALAVRVIRELVEAGTWEARPVEV